MEIGKAVGKTSLGIKQEFCPGHTEGALGDFQVETDRRSWTCKHGVRERVRAGEINVRLTRILIVLEAMRLDDSAEGVRAYRQEESKH